MTDYLMVDQNGTYVFDDGTNMSKEEVRKYIKELQYTYHEPANIVVISLYAPVLLCAVISNVLVIVVVFRFQHLRSVTNWFLVNLALSDLLVALVCMPMAVGTSIQATWLFGSFMCKFSVYLQGVSASSSVFSILAMSMDRYLAIRHPIIFRQVFSKSVARCVIVAIWIFAALLFAPMLFVRTVVELGFDVSYCVESWMDDGKRRMYNTILFVIIYAVPCATVLTAYISMGCKLCAPSVINNSDGVDITLDRDSRLLQSRRRVARTLLVLAFVFALCWLPYNICNLLLDTSSDDFKKTVSKTVMPFALWLGHANSAVNPLLYCFFSRNIRQCLWNLFRFGRRDRKDSDLPPLRNSRNSTPKSVKLSLNSSKLARRTADM